MVSKRRKQVDYDWNGLVDILENLITKYIDVLSLDDLPDPLPIDSENNNTDIAKSQIESDNIIYLKYISKLLRKGLKVILCRKKKLKCTFTQEYLHQCK